ncbi:hypothetical protein Tco_0577061 [Tanacetum coccineum]
MFKNFNRDDLEDLWKIVKSRFMKKDPVDDMDNLLLRTLNTMFEPQVEDTVWTYQPRLTKVKNWKLYDSCGVYCITMQNIVYYLLVEKTYPLTRNTLHQLWNDVRLQVDYEVEMAYELLRVLHEGSDGSLRSDGDGRTKVCDEKVQEDCLSNTDKLQRDEVQSNLEDVIVNEGNDMNRMNVDRSRCNGNRCGTKKDEVTRNEEMKDKKEVGDKRNKSYANVTAGSYNEFSRKLFTMLTETDEHGYEFVIFDEAIINEWCKKWEKTLSGYFVGHSMSVNELRYNLRKKWGSLGFKDIVDVNNGVGRVKFARVLVEVSAKKSLPHEIEVVYRDKNKVELCRKIVQVKYDWIPPRCFDCCVFWHNEKVCDMNKVVENHDDIVRNRKTNGVWNRGKNNNGNYKQPQGLGMGVQKEKYVSQFVFQKKTIEGPVVNTTLNISPTKVVNKANVKGDKKICPNSSGSMGKLEVFMKIS